MQVEEPEGRGWEGRVDEEGRRRKETAGERKEKTKVAQYDRTSGHLKKQER